MPVPTPSVTAQNTAPVWESDKLFREPRYDNGCPWTSDDDTTDADTPTAGD